MQVHRRSESSIVYSYLLPVMLISPLPRVESVACVLFDQRPLPICWRPQQSLFWEMLFPYSRGSGEENFYTTPLSLAVGDSYERIG